ncbi:hypothetical protein [Natronomonas sp.]|uniref:hypothetical protein n=1 Tax=Natronomonas sp. TaxID=2184060 RepID=UPI002FC353BC
MKRRAVLAGSGITLLTPVVGCLTTRKRDGETGGENGQASIRIVDVTADPPPDLPIEPAVSVVTAEATATTPASIAVGWENTDDRAVRAGEADSIVFSATRSKDENVQLLAFDRIGDRSEKVSFEDCWYVSGDLVFDGDYEVIDLEPGKRHTAEPDLYASDDACLTSDSYEFETLVSVEDQYGREEKTEEWGFALDINVG